MAGSLVVSRTPFVSRAALPLDASGVVRVGKRRLAFINNRDPHALYEFSLKADGTQRRPVSRRPLRGLPDGSLTDPEGLAQIETDGLRQLVVASSLSARPGRFPTRDGLVRIRYTPEGELRGEAMTGFRRWLLSRYPSLAAAAQQLPDRGGLNIEGLAWDPVRCDLLLGVRSPTRDGQASVIRIHLDLAAPWTVAALQAGPITHIRSGTVPAQGVRDISYDTARGEFLVVLGRSAGGDRVPFELCTWSGNGAAAEVLRVEFESSMKPEGVAVFDIDGLRRVVIVDDAGGFATFRATDVPGWD
ncbi:hypothetical protein [Mycolicibacterium mageritense]|uniref:hypothetical protein n=1 Tax=Mycolicibacterium mageritense TaxID=53462 RepID=UPI001E4DF061|nr:hypothetical protein [Mycolicibacterium mageritense]MCC9179641.1 hypothetical protein [Mycolicibacterium mageritense]